MITNPVNNILKSPNQRLESLVKKAKWLEQLANDFTHILPDQLKDHYQVANFEQQKLLIIAENPTWATKIRYLIPELLEKLQQREIWKTLEKIECVTRPKNFKKPDIKKEPKNISNRSKSLLESVAKTIKDKNLQEALKRLAKR